MTVLLKLSAIQFKKTNMVAEKNYAVTVSDMLYICYRCHRMQGSVCVSVHADTEKKNAMQCTVSILYTLVSN